MAATLDARLRLNSAEFSGGLNRALRESNAFVGKMTQQFGTLRNVLTGGAVGLLAGVGITSSIEQAAEFEKFERMLALVSGGAEAAKLELNELRKVAQKPGIDLESAVQATIRLKTMGYTSQEARKHMEALANKVAAFGGGGEEMKGVLLALSQISAKGKISAEEINQIAERLPTVRRDMKEAFGTANTEELQKMNLAAEDFINTLLNKWSEAPPMVSGITEELKKFRMAMDEIKGYAGQVFAPIVSEATGAIQRFAAAHRALLLDVDKLFGGGLARRMDAEDFLGRMQRAEADANALAGRENDPAKVKAAEEARLKRLEESDRLIREFREKRGGVMDLAKQQADDEQAQLEIVRAQLAEITDIEEVTRAINDAYQNQNAISDELFSKYQQIVQLKREEANLEERINRKRAEEINRKVAEEMLGPQERRQRMRDQNDKDRAMRRVMREEERNRLKEEERKARKNMLDDIKEGKFWDKDEARKRIRENVAKEWKDIFKDSKEHLKNIETILRTLATA